MINFLFLLDDSTINEYIEGNSNLEKKVKNLRCH